MAINLSKGGKINLAKAAPGLQQVGVGLGWDVNNTTGFPFDLDASVFMLTSTGKIPEDEYFIFYNNLRSPDGAVEHKGDNRTGAGEGDDETVLVNLSRVGPHITEILFVATLHDSEMRKQSFGQVENAFIRVYEMSTNKEIVKFELTEDFSNASALEFGKLYRENDGWRFEALGDGYENALQGLVDKYA